MTAGVSRGLRRALTGAALVVALVLGACYLVVQARRINHESAWEHPGLPSTDEQAKAQVVGPAKQIGAIGRLQRATGGYMLMSCKNETDPPYQGAVYLQFDLPPDALAFFDRLAAAMVAQGWTEGMAPNHDLPAKTLTKDGVTAIFGRNSDYLQIGTARVYGECRDVGDHRGDTTGWVDITDQLR